jgi:hypothetical protein
LREIKLEATSTFFDLCYHVVFTRQNLHLEESECGINRIQLINDRLYGLIFLQDQWSVRCLHTT